MGGHISRSSGTYKLVKSKNMKLLRVYFGLFCMTVSFALHVI